MSKYLFIESRDPFESKDTIQLYGLIKELSHQGHNVALYLVQNGAFSSRKNANVQLFPELLKEQNIKVYVDDDSLEERGISKDEIHQSLVVSNMDQLSDLVLEEGRKPIWH
jgi:sulfur relay (sulfurtransferase) complex TusBCD TusD component (DsrE family)